MKIGHLKESFQKLFKAGVSCRTRLTAWLVCFLPLSASLDAFDRVENWGFDQGGGYRMGSFTDEDANLVVTCMASNTDRKFLAVGGALGNEWAARVYSLESNGPRLLADWTGVGARNLPFSTITSVTWLNNLLACGVEYLDGDQTHAGVVFLNPDSPENPEFFELDGWDSLCSVRKDSADQSKLWVLGTKNEKSICRSINSSNEMINEFRIANINIPRAMAITDNQVWVCGENRDGESFVEVFVDGKKGTKLEPPMQGHFVSDMQASGEKVFLTGRIMNKQREDEMEDFFLLCLKLNEQGKKIDFAWPPIETESFAGSLDREIGTALLPTQDGGVVVSGNFRRYWKLGPSHDGKLALLPPDSSENASFEGFLARFDDNGSLKWAQTSGITGDDFTVALATDGEGRAILMGNRIIGGGFGPYLSTVNLGGNPEKNAVLMDRNLTNTPVISWDPPKTLRFGEPVDGTYLSARSNIRLNFQYRLDGELINDGDQPIFDPGELDFSVRTIGENEQNETRVIKGLKGIPYLKVEYEQIGGEIVLSGQLSGLHPDHIADLDQNLKLHESIKFERLKDDGSLLIDGERLVVEQDFNGKIEVVGSFPGDTHYEPVTRAVSLLFRNGRLVDPDQVDQNMVNIQVRDLDGWQQSRSVLIGQQTIISATQGFGRKKKFKRWVEFAEEDKILRTARVESPFSLRSALFAEENMTLFAFYNSTFSGTAINGYLNGSTVFLDFNFNGRQDEGEPSGFSTSNGAFEIEISDEEILLHDKNQNGLLDADEGMFVVLGGMDNASKLPLSISYRAPATYSVITAVSTLVAEFLENDFSLEESEAIVSQYLSLPEDIDLSSFEPLREVFNDGEKAKTFVLRATQLSNLFNEGSRFLQMKSGNKLDRISSAEKIVTALKNFIVQESPRRSGMGMDFLDLNDQNLLISVIESADELVASEGDSAETTNAEDFTQSTSARATLAESQPEIAALGNEIILHEIVDQISNANVVLEQLNENPDVAPTQFKALASATQNVLDNLGEATSNTIFVEEVTLLSEASTESEVEVLALIDLSNTVMSLSDVDSPSNDTSSEGPDSVDSNDPPVNNEVLESFNLDVLNEFVSQSEINIYAPVFSKVEVFSPNEIGDDTVLGSFSAYDPEGTAVSYEIIAENPDYDLDDIPMLSIDAQTGEIQIQDFDDLSLMTVDTVSPVVRFSDADGLSRDEQVELNIAEWTYFAGRLQIPDLSLSVPENLPVGTTIHTFDKTDVHGGAIEYQLVAGTGDTDNELFEIAPDGTLKTRVVFDYEAGNHELAIRLQAVDSRFNSVEDSLTVRVSDILLPNVQTGEATVNNSNLNLNAMFTRFGDLTDDLKFGFYLSTEPISDPSQSGVEKIFSTSIGDASFTAVTSANLAGGAYYYTAFAESMEGMQFGTEKAFLLPRINGGGEWTDGSPIENFDNWWESEWFGLYSTTYYPWIYHKNLGWVYVYHGTANGAWLYHQNLGWMWTNPDSFPYLYVSKAMQWSYLNLGLFKTTLYDFTEKQWFLADVPIKITLNISPENGGEITGLGNYYRWDRVVLEANPFENYNFAGWSGDINSMNTILEFEAIRDTNLESSFLAIPDVNSSPEEILNNIKQVLDKMDHLSEADKEKSIAELILSGTSVTSGLSIR